MTDEEKAKLSEECQAGANRAADERMRADREFRDRMIREETAATILAALIQEGQLTQGECVECAVALTDALRAELAKEKP